MLIEHRARVVALGAQEDSKSVRDNACSKFDDATQGTRFFFVTPVWGINHLNLFLEIGLPSLLAPGNLPSLSNPSGCRFLVYTRECDEERLTGAEVFQRLKALMPVEVHRIPEPLANAHRVMSDCHIAALRSVDTESAAAVFIPPDCVWANGGMARLEQLSKAGKSMVHISGVRLDRDAVVPRLREYLSEDYCTLDIGARPLVSIGLGHLHAIAMLHFWNEHDGGLMPANLYWSVLGEGLALRCFHLHPLMVKPQRKFARFNSTIDDDLGRFACPDESRDYIVSDSDEILTFELSGPERIVTGDFRKGVVESAAGWVELGTNIRHQFLVRHPIRIHAGPITEEKWRSVEQEGDALVTRLRDINNSSSFELALHYPSVLRSRDYAMSINCGRYTEGVSRLSRYGVKALVRLGDAGRTARALSFTSFRPAGRAPFLAAHYQRLGNVKRRLRFFDSAIEDYTTAISLNPSSPLLYLLRGRVLLQKAEIERAIVDFRAGLKLHPESEPLLALLKKSLGEDDNATDDELRSVLRRRTWLFASDGTMRFGHPKWMMYRSLLRLLNGIIQPSHRNVLLVGDYGYLRSQLKQVFPHVNICAIPLIRRQALGRAMNADWDLIVWNDLDRRSKADSHDWLSKFMKTGNRVVCVVGSERRWKELASLVGEVHLLPDRSARFCSATARVFCRAQVWYLDFAWHEHGMTERLLNRSLGKMSGMSAIFGVPLSGIGALIHLIGRKTFGD